MYNVSLFYLGVLVNKIREKEKKLEIIREKDLFLSLFLLTFI